MWVRRVRTASGATAVQIVESEGRRLGVERICTVVQVPPSTYYAATTRPPSARAIRDAALRPVLRALWEENYCVYGARKLWKAARRAGHEVGRDQVARLMHAEGITGVSRTKRVRTTRPAGPGIRTSSSVTSPPPPRTSCGSPTSNADVGIRCPPPTSNSAARR